MSDSSNNAKQAAWVAISSFCSFLVGIVSPMILARYFDKSDYGTYKQVIYVYNTLLFVFTLGLPKAYAYYLPKYASEFSKDIINKITKIFLVLGSLFTLFLIVFSGIIANILRNPDLKLALMLFSPTPFFLLPTLGLDSIYASFRKTQYLALYTIVTKILTILCIVLPVVLFNGNYLHAIIGFDVASLLSCLIALYMKSWPVREYGSQKADVTYSDIFKFAIPLFYASIWGMIINSANQFFVSRYYGTEEFASFSNGFMANPIVGMVISAIAAILLPAFSGLDKGKGMSNQMIQLWKSSVLMSAKIIFPMLIYSTFFSSIVMTCMDGNLYSDSAVFFQIKNIGDLFYIIPFAPILLAIGKTKDYANVHMIVAILIVVLEFLVCKLALPALWIAIVSELCNVIKIILMMRIIIKFDNRTIQDFFPIRDLFMVILVSSITSIITLLLLRVVDLNKFTALFVSILLFVVIYYLICRLFKLSYKDVVCRLVKIEDTNPLMRFIP